MTQFYNPCGHCMRKTLLALLLVPQQFPPASIIPPTRRPISPQTRKMAALLVKIYNDQDWKTDPSKDAIRAQYFQSLLDAKPAFDKELLIRKWIADTLLRAGTAPKQSSSLRKSQPQPQKEHPLMKL